MNAARAINHHADHPGFSGVTGVLCGLVFLLGRAKAQLAADIAPKGTRCALKPPISREPAPMPSRPVDADAVASVTVR